MQEKSQVVIIFPGDHPHSEVYRQALCLERRERLERAMATWSLCCPYCLGLLPADSVYCAWRTRQRTCLAN